MGLVLVMAGTDLRRRLRDRSALITGVVAPFALAAIVSVALGAGAEGFEAEIAVVDADGSDTSRALAGGLLAASRGDRRAGGISFVPVATERAAADGVADEELGAALVFPAGFEEALARGRPQAVRVVRDADRAVAGDVAVAIAKDVVARIEAASLSAAVVSASGRASPERLARLAGEVDAVRLPATLDQTGPGGEDLELAAYFGPSMAILFLFLTVGMGARSLLAEQRGGTLARLRAAPTSVAAIVAAKTLAVFVLGLASICTLWLATSVVFGASWGPVLPVFLLCALTVLAIAGISTLVTALARTEQQAEGYTSMITFTLAIVGGNFVSPGDLPPLLRRLSLVTPNGLALRAFTELATGEASLSVIAPALVVLAAIGVVTGAVALGLLRQLVRS